MAAYTTIDDPSAFFKVQLYTGNGSANHAITFDDTDTDMQPDFVWIKNRDATDVHCLFDAARGVTKDISCGDAEAEFDNSDALDTFSSDGFQVDADVKVNTNNEKYVAWCWSAGTGSGSSNTTGTINTTTTTVNTTSKFSISTYTGNDTAGGNFGHGLGVAPELVLVRSRGGDSWRVFHTDNTAAPETDYLVLDTTAATVDNAVIWNDTAPSSTIITLGTAGSMNESANTYISYAWAGVQGFSKFGRFEGTGNADGRFVYTGFRPAFIVTKSIDSTSSWHFFDNKREGYNVDNDALEAESTVEATADQIDILSNGFKCRIATDPNVAETYIYAAFAEAPFVNSNGVPCNAR